MAPPGLEFWSLSGLSLALLILAAKTHGRQIRLERELEGYWEVKFGRGPNPAWVEALWRKDRIRFWTLLPALAVGLVSYLLIASVSNWPAPDVSTVPGSWRAPGTALLATFLWSPTLTFLVNGLASLLRFRRELRAPPRGTEHSTRREKVKAQRPDWLDAARRGTIGWWSLSLCLAAAVLVILA